MLPYANYCVLFDTRFAGGAVQFVHAVVPFQEAPRRTRKFQLVYFRVTETPNAER